MSRLILPFPAPTAFRRALPFPAPSVFRRVLPFPAPSVFRRVLPFPAPPASQQVLPFPAPLAFRRAFPFPAPLAFRRAFSFQAPLAFRRAFPLTLRQAVPSAPLPAAVLPAPTGKLPLLLQAVLSHLESAAPSVYRQAFSAPFPFSADAVPPSAVSAARSPASAPSASYRS